MGEMYKYGMFCRGLGEEDFLEEQIYREEHQQESPVRQDTTAFNI